MKFTYPYCSIENVYEMFEFEFNQKMKDEHKGLKKFIYPLCILLSVLMWFIFILCVKSKPTHISYIHISKLLLPLCIMYSLMNYYSDFSKVEKSVAEGALDNILVKGKIRKTKCYLDELIYESEILLKKRTSLLQTFNSSWIYSFIKNTFLLIITFTMGFLSSEMSKEGISNASKNFFALFNLLLEMETLLVLVFIIWYSMLILPTRKLNLYIDTLKSKKTQIILSSYL